MIRLLLIFFIGLSSVPANAGDKKFPNIKENQSDKQDGLRDDKENKNSLTLPIANGATSAALIYRFLDTVPKDFYDPHFGWGSRVKTLFRPEIALPEAVLATASVIVDVKPSTANTVVGWSNVIWGGIKLALFFVDPVKTPLTNALLLSTIATNGVNAVYRLWWGVKKANSVKK